MSKLYIVDIFLIELRVIPLNDLVSRHFAFDLVVPQRKALARMQILMYVNFWHIANTRTSLNTTKH